MFRAHGVSAISSTLVILGAVLLACTGEDPVLVAGNDSTNDGGVEASGGGGDSATGTNPPISDGGGEQPPPATGEVVFSTVVIADNVLANDVAFDATGNVFVGGAYRSASAVDFGSGKSLPANGSVYDGFVAKFDKAGTCLWVVAVGGAADGARIVKKVAVTTAGGVVFGASTRSTNVLLGTLTASGWGDEDITIGRLDAAGSALWLRSYASAGAESIAGLAVDPAGRIALTGSFVRKTAVDIAFDGVVANPPTHEMPIGFVALMTEGGVTQALKAFPVPAGDPLSSQVYPRDVVFTEGGVLVGGEFSGKVELRYGEPGTSQVVASAGANDGFLAKLDGAFKTAWATTVGATGLDALQSVAIDPRNGEVHIAFSYGAGATFAGAQLPQLGGSIELGLGRFNANGAMLEGSGYGSAGVENPTKLVVDRWGNTLVAGMMTGNIDFGKVATSYGGVDGFVAKLSPDKVGLWAYGIGGSTGNDEIRSVAVDGSGNVGIVGNLPGEGNPKTLFGKTVNVAPGKNASFLVVTKP